MSSLPDSGKPTASGACRHVAASVLTVHCGQKHPLLYQQGSWSRASNQGHGDHQAAVNAQLKLGNSKRGRKNDMKQHQRAACFHLQRSTALFLLIKGPARGNLGLYHLLENFCNLGWQQRGVSILTLTQGIVPQLLPKSALFSGISQVMSMAGSWV